MRTICLYSVQLHCAGGVESVVRDLYAMLPQGGIRVVVAREFGSVDWLADGDGLCLAGTDRAAAWKDFVTRHHVGLVVFNHVAREHQDAVVRDIECLQAMGVACVKMVHASFPSPMLLAGDECTNREMDEFARKCTAVFTVSQADAKYWTALGHRAVCIQNPIHVPQRTRRAARAECDESKTVRLLWVGRQCDAKQPELAVEAFARACGKTDRIRLTMVGGTDRGWSACRRQARRLGVSDRIEFLAARPDITDLWNAADIHLLTSVTESFCLVLAEAKGMGIPTVMFALPGLELTAQPKGLVSVPGGDVEGLAGAIVRLAEDDRLRTKLGAEAEASLAAFSAEKVLADWRAALSAVETGKGFADVSDDARLIAAALTSAWNRYCDRNLWLVRLEENARRWRLSVRPLARVLEKAVAGVRWLRGRRRP